MSAEISETTLVLVPRDEPPPGPWEPWLLGGIVLAVAAAAAFRRSRRGGAPHNRRAARAFWSAVTCAAGTAPIVTFPEVSIFDPSGFELVATVARFLVIGLLVFVLIGVADLLLDILRPRRNAGWLVAGLIILPAFVAGLLLGSGQMDIDPESALADLAMLLPLFGAAVTWWSHLPTAERPVAHIFE